MQFSSYRRGALLTALQAFVIGIIVCCAIWVFSVFFALIFIALWAIACLLIYLRLCCAKVFTLHGILYVEKGKLFPHNIRVPICRIIGVNIIRTPLAFALDSCWCFVYTSGFTFMLLGIHHNDALKLQALVTNKDI